MKSKALVVFVFGVKLVRLVFIPEAIPGCSGSPNIGPLKPRSPPTVDVFCSFRLPKSGLKLPKSCSLSGRFELGTNPSGATCPAKLLKLTGP